MRWKQKHFRAASSARFAQRLEQIILGLHACLGFLKKQSFRFLNNWSLAQVEVFREKRRNVLSEENCQDSSLHATIGRDAFVPAYFCAGRDEAHRLPPRQSLPLERRIQLLHTFPSVCWQSCALSSVHRKLSPLHLSLWNPTHWRTWRKVIFQIPMPCPSTSRSLANTCFVRSLCRLVQRAKLSDTYDACPVVGKVSILSIMSLILSTFELCQCIIWVSAKVCTETDFRRLAGFRFVPHESSSSKSLSSSEEGPALEGGWL